MMKTKINLASLAFLLAPTFAPSWCPPFSVDLIRVIDGDTVLVMAGGRSSSLRLTPIDAPEMSHICDGVKIGEMAKIKLTSLIGSRLKIEVMGVDIYGRTLASLPEVLQLVESGWAVPYQMAKFTSIEEKRSYFSAFYRAHREQLGMFACKSLMNPLFYRKKFKSKLK